MDKRIKLSSLLICELLIKTRHIRRPNYKNWLARTKWTVFEAGCLLNGIDPYSFFLLQEIIETNSPNCSIYEPGFIAASELLLLEIRAKEDIILTWIPKQNRTIPPDKSEENPLKLINAYLMTVGSIPEKLLMHAKKTFMLLYQSREATEDTRKNWKDNWHTVAPPFKALVDKSTKTKKDISPRKEETLLALIGALTDKYFIGNKYKKPNGSHKTSTIAEDIINHISKQFPDNQIPHGFKKSNLIEIINDSFDCWNKKKES
jgi:hypothetical protein